MRVSKAKTLIALKGSIRKWSRVLLGTGREQGGFNCPLCQIFNVNDRDCVGCPVYARTRKTSCKGTPYEEWIKAGNPTYTRYLTDAQVIAAKHELEFLKALL